MDTKPNWMDEIYIGNMITEKMTMGGMYTRVEKIGVLEHLQCYCEWRRFEKTRRICVQRGITSSYATMETRLWHDVAEKNTDGVWESI